MLLSNAHGVEKHAWHQPVNGTHGIGLSRSIQDMRSREGDTVASRQTIAILPSNSTLKPIAI